MNKVFLRGQVWYWEDPIYGKKSDNYAIDEGERTMRYSRYVLIVQSDDTIDRYGINVIPLSSQNHSTCDVPIVLSFPSGFENTCFCKTRALFPVYPSQLKNYICTLTDETMRQIELQMMKLLLPRLMDENILHQAGFNIDSVNVPIDDSKSFDIETEKEIENSVGRNKKWTDDNIRTFIYICKNKGLEVAADEFDLKESSANKYYMKWRKMYGLENKEDDISSYNTEIIIQSISSFCNMLYPNLLSKFKEDCVESIYDEIYTPNERSKGRHLDDIEFHKKLRGIIYYTFIRYMGFEEDDDGNLVWEHQNREGFMLAFFFTKIYEEDFLSRFISVSNIVDEFRNKYKRVAIDEKWGEVLHNNFISQLNIKEEGAKILYNKVKSLIIDFIHY